MSDSARAAASRAAFAERFPELAPQLDSAAGTSVLCLENGEAVDIALDERRLYGGDARRFAAEQVAAFMDKPLRLFMERPASAGLVSPVCIRLLDAIGEELLADGLEEISRQPVESPTFLVVFGVGLGHHLKALARHTGARWLILCEPFLEFLPHAFHTVDWSALFAQFETRGGGVHIVTETDPGRMVTGIVRFMSAQGIAYVDGAWVFTHYPLWAFSEGRKRLYEAVEFAFINRGFFEDELVMMRNAVANFSRRGFWLMEGRPRLHRPELAVIVGSGPSLDEGIEVLHRIRDRVVIFSGGTSLRPLLRQGIVPDFHCELENVPAVCDVLAEAAKYGDLSRITLLASATVDPRVPPLFGDTVFFFRDSVSPTRILARKHLLIAGAAPTCVNMAVSMAAFLGFTELMLFGTDCGVRPGAEHHAKDTVYRDVGLWKQHAERTLRFPMEVEGNFGGIAMTDWIYDSCRLMLAEVIERRGLTVINCSDGALIPGAVPRVPEAVEVTAPPIDRPALRAALERSLDRYRPGQLLARSELPAIAQAAETMFRDLDRLLGELEQGEADFAQAYHAVRDFVAAAGDRYQQTDAIISGTLHALPRIAMFFGFRVADKALRQRIFARFIGEFRAIVARMRGETEALFDELAGEVRSSAADAAGD